MKKRTIKLAVLSLMMTAVLFNCKKDDSDPTAPDTEITDKLKAITMPVITPEAPAAPVVTPASVSASAQATEVNGALGSIASSGTVPASVATAATAVSSALSASDVAAINSVSATTLASISDGGAVPADIKAVLDKVKANPTLAAYLPKFTFPTVAGVTVTARIAGTEAVEKVEKVGAAIDECQAAAAAVFNPVKAALDASKTTQTNAVNAAYTAAVALIAPAQTACESSSSSAALYDGFRSTANTQAQSALTALAGAKAVLGAQYDLIVALTNVSLVDALDTINQLEKAGTKSCAAIAAAATANAATVKASNQAKVDAAYNTALSEANALNVQALATCHNQGSI
ncbi:hypothetical protein Dfri01_21680 [Dyadobacter frigoris]|uniref:hypothetical protein n=1 Tax=Dyadobacter frigoris TaxID=2576211 RepID=UPI0024A0A9F9|nr:hypothetical protein [Dyadobacter frigoris]GLU52707.1 hypothetical protein Dfri01_21680 [Dyadobacter frigoris]